MEQNTYLVTVRGDVEKRAEDDGHKAHYLGFVTDVHIQAASAEEALNIAYWYGQVTMCLQENAPC